MTLFNSNLNKPAHYNKLASELLSQKSWPRYFTVGYYSEDYGGEIHEFNIPLTEEQYNEMKPIAEQCKAEDIDLWDYYYDSKFPEYLLLDEPGFYCEPRTIDLDMANYPCKIKLAIFYDGVEKAPQVIERVLVFSHDEYLELLEWQLMHRNASYNDLYDRLPELFKIVDDKVRSVFDVSNIGIMPYEVPAFVVELTGIKEDAFHLCGEDSKSREIYRHINDDYAENTFVLIEDRKMYFRFEHFDYDKSDTTESLLLDDIDAIAVQRALGVDNYAGIMDSLSVYFGASDGVARFAEFLRSKSIDFVENSVN